MLVFVYLFECYDYIYIHIFTLLSLCWLSVVSFCSSYSVCSFSWFVIGLGWFSVFICVLFFGGSWSIVVLVSGGMSSLVQLVLQAGHRFRLCGIPCCRQT